MSQSPARRARRECKRWGHDFVVKTDSNGRWVTLPCSRCGAEPEPSDVR